MIAPASAPLPTVPSLPIYLGVATDSGAPYWLRPDALLRGVHLRGAIGAGKTSLARRLLLGRGLGAPFAQFDYIGTGHRELQAVIAAAATALAIAEDRCPAHLAGSTAAFLRRYGFLAVGAPNPAIQIDLLRRRQLPDGRTERIRDVTSRAIEVLLVKLNDADVAQRVRFLRNATALLAVLAAADRPISDGLTFLNDAQFASFLDRELDARTIRASEWEFLQYQRAELQRVLALRPDDPRKSWRAFDEEMGSTRNSLNDFAPGTVLGDIFNDETFPLEAVAFGDACLSVTNREPEDLQRAKAYQAIHAMLHALCLHRQDTAGVPPLAIVIDEPWWVRRNIPGILAVARNLGVSYWVSHQSDAQWEDIGLRIMGVQLRALANLQITFRPESFLDAKDEVLHARPIAPDGMVQRFWTSSYGDSDQTSSSIARAWGNVFQYADDGLLRGSAGSSNRTETSSNSSGSSSGEHEVLNVV
ncbi:MAG: hypothetical protein JOZ54_09930, partial [Acidobacteria bacterium]|nr:hypothetical protein [Acidobacteriota bacterium]